jgi:cytochrome c oxidase cbb3-type subunit III
MNRLRCRLTTMRQEQREQGEIIMSAFWHWFVVIITLAFIAAMVWLFIATGRARVPSGTNTEGEETTGHVWDEDLTELNNPMPRWWLWLFYGTVIWSLIYLVMYPGLGRYEGVLGWTSEGQYEEEMTRATEEFEQRFGELVALPLDELASDPDALRLGRNLFAHNCSTCHGSDARGARGYPNLTDGHWIWGGSTEQIWTSIHEGRQAVMPGFGSALNDQEVTRTAVYVQQLAGSTSTDHGRCRQAPVRHDLCSLPRTRWERQCLAGLA